MHRSAMLLIVVVIIIIIIIIITIIVIILIIIILMLIYINQCHKSFKLENPAMPEMQIMEALGNPGPWPRALG